MQFPMRFLGIAQILQPFVYLGIHNIKLFSKVYIYSYDCLLLRCETLSVFVGQPKNLYRFDLDYEYCEGYRRST